MSNTLKQKAMKRLSILGLMLASAFALTNCTEQVLLPDVDNDIIVDEITNQESPEEELSIPFEVYATAEADAETKTTNSGNDTEWKVNDQINVYHAPAGTTTFKKHAEFTIRDVVEGLFGGALKYELSASNDWYFLYPWSATGDTPTNAQVTIGASKDENGLYVQTLSADSKSHIAGPNYPMYGVQTKVSMSNNPRVKMKHLSSLVALKVVNQGDGIKDNGDESIIVKELSFSVPKVGSKQSELAITGAFTVNTTGSKVSASNFTPVTGSSSSTVTLKLTESVTIPAGEEATFYIAVRPFNASTINPNNTDPILEVSINGSKRQVSIPANKANFEPGKITTLRVPVKLSHPKTSDALSTTQKVGYEFISWSNKNDVTVNVNGESVGAFVVGDGKQGTITITGKIEDLINALPATFYASYWNNAPAAMTVTNVNAWVKEGDNYTPIADYGPLNTAIRSELKGPNDKVIYDGIFKDYDLTDTAVELVTSFLGSGIPREDNTFGLCLTKFIAPQTITFRGILSNQASKGDAILILDEEPIHKILGSDNINSLFNQKFNGATYEGLVDIIKGKNTPAAITTSEILYNTVDEQFSKDANQKERVITIKKEVNIIIGKFVIDADVRFKAVLDAFFKNAEEMRNLLPKLKLSITIGTYPYSATDSDYGSKGAPKETSAPYNPLIFLGLDAYGN